MCVRFDFFKVYYNEIRIGLWLLLLLLWLDLMVFFGKICLKNWLSLMIGYIDDRGFDEFKYGFDAVGIF